ncbi:TPR domain-containing glycosyltransferase [Clostridium sediminicola]|uniref:glycosyltransferase n=1 Tax=Clostridium sediminicola TaxID=3114879 RepID=UPI0031F1DE9D
MISLCMIVKNEEDNLERCLKSAEGIADEIIIVDTGSTDSTVEIAKKYTSNVYFYQWHNDFSAARNFSVSKAKGDWILILDADDEIVSKYKNDIRELTKDDSVDVYCFNTLNLINENDINNIILNLNPRLFKNKPDYRYKGAVHNQILSVILKVNPNAKIKNVPIDIYHYGYLNSCIKKKHKRERNMPILSDQLERNPEDPVVLYYMGNEYFAIEDTKKALDYYLKSYDKFSPNNNIYPKLILRILICCINLKLYDDFFMYAKIVLKYYPEFTDIYYLKGYLNYLLGRPTAAIRDIEKALELGEPDPSLAYFKGVGTYKSTALLCNIYFNYEDYEKCVYCFPELLKYPETSNFDTIKTLVHCLYKLKSSKENIENVLKIILNSSREKGFLCATNLLITEKDYNLALEYISKGLEYFHSTSLDGFIKNNSINNLQYLKGVCEVHLKDYEKSMKTFNNIIEDKFVNKSKLYIFLSTMHSKNKKAINFYASKDTPQTKVYTALYNIFNNKKTEMLSNNKKDSVIYEEIIFTIFEFFLDINEYDKFEKALGLLDLISSNNIHLLLGKLYYEYGKYELSKKELMRSIEKNNLLDEKGARILYILCKKEIE